LQKYANLKYFGKATLQQFAPSLICYENFVSYLHLIYKEVALML